MTTERYLTLLGGPPWGFRISGGNDQDYPPYISQVRFSRPLLTQELKVEFHFQGHCAKQGGETRTTSRRFCYFHKWSNAERFNAE